MNKKQTENIMHFYVVETLFGVSDGTIPSGYYWQFQQDNEMFTSGER